MFNREKSLNLVVTRAAHAAGHYLSLIADMTLEDAKAWNETDEKTLHCMDVLDLCFQTDGDNLCDQIMGIMEEHLTDILTEEGIVVE